MQAAIKTPAVITRAEIADHIVARLERCGEEMRRQFTLPGRVPSCLVDDLLPAALAQEIHAAFPPSGRMSFKNSIKERKYVPPAGAGTK